MTHLLDPANISALRFNEATCEAVDLVCQPLLHHIGITHFGHIRIFDDSTMLRLANNVEWTRRYFEKSFYNDIDLYGMRDVPENESRIMLLTGQPTNDHCTALCYDYDIWNALVIYERFSGYSKFWFFATGRCNTEIINYYVNNIPIFKKFIVYFEERFKETFTNFDKESLISSKVKTHPYYSATEEKNKEFLSKINLKKYRFQNDIYFSARETECMYHLSCGKSVKEIGSILGLSPRTIESYIVNVKNKTGCNNKSQIIKLFENQKNAFNP